MKEIAFLEPLRGLLTPVLGPADSSSPKISKELRSFVVAGQSLAEVVGGEGLESLANSSNHWQVNDTGSLCASPSSYMGCVDIELGTTGDPPTISVIVRTTVEGAHDYPGSPESFLGRINASLLYVDPDLQVEVSHSYRPWSDHTPPGHTFEWTLPLTGNGARVLETFLTMGSFGFRALHGEHDQGPASSEATETTFRAQFLSHYGVTESDLRASRESMELPQSVFDRFLLPHDDWGKKHPTFHVTLPAN